MDMNKNYYVIFGAAVKENGEPSGTLARRTLGAWALSNAQENAYFLATGGKGRYGDSEASVIAKLLLAKGVQQENIILDEDASDTLESILNCSKILKQCASSSSIYICSSPYHNWRCQILFWLSGIKAVRGNMPSDRPALGTRKWLFYYCRELVAIPWDVFLLGLNKIAKGV
jgi:vancomycin permeability regulator SanA